MNRILAIFLVLCSGIIHAQNYGDKSYYLVDSLNLDVLVESDKHLMDSALSLYHAANHDTIRMNAIMILTQEMIHEDWIKYNTFMHEQLNEMLAMSSLDEKEMYYVKRTLASVLGDQGYYAHYYQSKIPEALDYFQQALALSEEIGDKYTMATMLNNIGSSSEISGNIIKALDYYHRSIMICEEIGNIKGMPSVLNNIGLIYMNQGNYTDALDYFQRSLRIHQELGQAENVTKNLENIGHCYSGMGDHVAAMDFYQRSVEMAEEVGDQSVIARVSMSISEGYIRQGDLVEAERVVKLADSIYQAMGNKHGVEMASNLHGQIELQRNNIKEAKAHATRSITLARELGFPESIRDAAYLWSTIYREEGNYKNGWDMFELYIEMRDSVLNDNIKKSAIRQQTQYEFEKAQLLKEQEERERIRLAEEARTRRNNVQYAIILVSLLFLFVGISFMGYVRVSPRMAQGIIYLAILILFESSLVIADPYVENIANGEPAFKLIANVGIALLLFPLHTLFDRTLKRRIVKTSNGRKGNHK